MTEPPQPPSIVTRSPMSRRELRELVAEEVRQEVARLAYGYMQAIAELRDDLHEELAGLDRRVTEVHERALRALTDSIQRRGKL